MAVGRDGKDGGEGVGKGRGISREGRTHFRHFILELNP